MRNYRYHIYLLRSSSFCPTMPLCLGSQTTQTLTNIFTGSLLTKEASPDTETATGSFEMIRQSGLRSSKSTLQPAVIYTLASCPLERTRVLFCWKRYSNILLSLDLGFLKKKYFLSIINIFILFLSLRVTIKEYILVIEGTVPAIVLQWCDSPNLSPLCLLYSNYLTVWQSRRGEVGWVTSL